MNDKSTIIYGMESEDMEPYLLGQTIVSIDQKTVKLADGTELLIEDTYDCCAWFKGDFEAFDFEDNVITAVKEVRPENGRDYPNEGNESWSIHILSAHKLIAQVNINGDHTSGYYCHSVDLVVSKGEK